jgi:hypothetical protein
MNEMEMNIVDRPGGEVLSYDERLPSKIRSMNLGPIIWKLTNEESELPESQRLTPAQALRLSEEYRRFLALAVLANGRTTTPSRTIDNFWHQHILDTQKYYDDMMEIFGHMMHHFPYLGVRGEADKERLLDAYEDTKLRYAEMFGEVPTDVWGFAAHCGSSHCSSISKCTSVDIH